jgi:hypothetical protein
LTILALRPRRGSLLSHLGDHLIDRAITACGPVNSSFHRGPEREAADLRKKFNSV